MILVYILMEDHSFFVQQKHSSYFSHLQFYASPNDVGFCKPAEQNKVKRCSLDVFAEDFSLHDISRFLQIQFLAVFPSPQKTPQLAEVNYSKFSLVLDYWQR